jgi:hypothetical protein
VATTNYREDYLGRDLVAPTSAALDFMGRITTSTVDFMGRTLRRILRGNNTAYTAGTEIQFSGGTKYIVKTGGTSAGSPPSIPAVGDDVTDGTAVLTRTK